jgi:hypothetical protein
MAYGHVTDAAAEPWLRTSHRRSRELDHNAGTAATALSAASTLTPVLVSWHHTMTWCWLGGGRIT